MTLNEFLGSYEFTEKYIAQNGHDVYDYNIIEIIKERRKNGLRTTR